MDKEYGLPDKKKFPMPDSKHVKSAIKFFNYVDKDNEAALAAAIKAKAKKYGVVIRCGKKNRLSKYVDKNCIIESMGALNGMYGVMNGSYKQGTYETNPNNLGFDYIATNEYPYSKKKKKKAPDDEVKNVYYRFTDSRIQESSEEDWDDLDVFLDKEIENIQSMAMEPIPTDFFNEHIEK